MVCTLAGKAQSTLPLIQPFTKSTTSPVINGQHTVPTVPQLTCYIYLNFGRKRACDLETFLKWTKTFKQ